VQLALHRIYDGAANHEGDNDGKGHHQILHCFELRVSRPGPARSLNETAEALSVHRKGGNPVLGLSCVLAGIRSRHMHRSSEEPQRGLAGRIVRRSALSGS
jgi:hypothetical protein